MIKKRSINKIIVLMSILFLLQPMVLADVKQDFLKFVNIIKNQTINKVSKKINVQAFASEDPDAVANGKHCRSLAQPKQTPSGLLNCRGNYTYTVQNNKYRYTYSYSASGSKLKLVTLVSSTKYPIGYYNYSYPEGNLKSAVIELSAEKKMLFDPDGNLKLYTSPKMCIQDSKGELVQLKYAYQLCNKLFDQEEGVITNRR